MTPIYFWNFLSKFLQIVNSPERDTSQIKESDVCSLDLYNLSEERRSALIFPEASYLHSIGTPQLDLAVWSDFNKNILGISAMTDQFYQSPAGQAMHDMYIWSSTDKKPNDRFADSKQKKQSINGVFHVKHIQDMLAIAVSIYKDKDIPDVSITTSVLAVSRMMVRSCLNRLLESDHMPHDIKEFDTEHLKNMCHLILQEDFPLDKINRWLGFIQAGMTVHGIIQVDEEREHSRRLFHMAYTSEGINIPESYDLKNQ